MRDWVLFLSEETRGPEKHSEPPKFSLLIGIVALIWTEMEMGISIGWSLDTYPVVKSASECHKSQKAKGKQEIRGAVEVFRARRMVEGDVKPTMSE